MSSSSNPYWTHIRVQKDTHARLKQWAKGLDTARERGQNHLEPGDQGWSMDQLVNILLDRDEDHRRRSAKASRAARKRGKEARQRNAEKRWAEADAAIANAEGSKP